MAFKIIHQTLDEQGEIMTSVALQAKYATEAEAKEAIAQMCEEESPEEFQDQNNLYWARTVDGIRNRFQIEAES